MFNHDPVVFDEIESFTSADGYRKYQVDEDHAYTSVTTMLGETKPLEASTALANWTERLGAPAAQKESTRCADRGTAIHLALEKYIANELTWEQSLEEIPPWHKLGMKSVKRVVDRLDNIKAQEIPLFSHMFQLAGRVDLMGEYMKKKSTVDFKTSTKPKRIEWIGDYFLQTSIYSYMFEEMFGLCYDNLVVIIEVEGSEAQVFESNRRKHRQELKERIAQFRRNK